mmetsp:Transcript_9612/g.20662  ORF Transcript_9612/g.20662 Transcript_9612/m.20662 type:complete len:446 (+) Transcript_9612:1071-2408(+)
MIHAYHADSLLWGLEHVVLTAARGEPKRLRQMILDYYAAHHKNDGDNGDSDDDDDDDGNEFAQMDALAQYARSVTLPSQIMAREMALAQQQATYQLLALDLQQQREEQQQQLREQGSDEEENDGTTSNLGGSSVPGSSASVSSSSSDSASAAPSLRFGSAAAKSIPPHSRRSNGNSGPIVDSTLISTPSGAIVGENQERPLFKSIAQPSSNTTNRAPKSPRCPDASVFIATGISGVTPYNDTPYSDSHDKPYQEDSSPQLSPSRSSMHSGRSNLAQARHKTMQAQENLQSLMQVCITADGPQSVAVQEQRTTWGEDRRKSSKSLHERLKSLPSANQGSRRTFGENPKDLEDEKTTATSRTSFSSRSKLVHRKQQSSASSCSSACSNSSASLCTSSSVSSLRQRQAAQQNKVYELMNQMRSNSSRSIGNNSSSKASTSDSHGTDAD